LTKCAHLVKCTVHLINSEQRHSDLLLLRKCTMYLVTDARQERMCPVLQYVISRGYSKKKLKIHTCMASEGVRAYMVTGDKAPLELMTFLCLKL